MTKDAPTLAGKIALVTGASRGIGRAIAQRLAAAGATVVVTARSLDTPLVLPGTLLETVELIQRSTGSVTIPLAADLEDPRQRDSLIDRTVEITGGIQILVNVAGFTQWRRVELMPQEMFDLTVEHYLRVPFMLSKAAIPIMRTSGAGWIVNIGSRVQEMPAKPYSDSQRNLGFAVYGATKLALNRFTQGLAAELEADNIAVNMAIPSKGISTPGGDRLNPVGCPTEPVEYLAETVLALCHLPAKERTGLIAYSSHFPIEKDFRVYSLDGRRELPLDSTRTQGPA